MVCVFFCLVVSDLRGAAFLAALAEVEEAPEADPPPGPVALEPELVPVPAPPEPVVPVRAGVPAALAPCDALLAGLPAGAPVPTAALLDGRTNRGVADACAMAVALQAARRPGVLLAGQPVGDLDELNTERVKLFLSGRTLQQVRSRAV